MRQLHFLRSVMGDQKKSSGNKICVSDLLYYASVQHQHFFFFVVYCRKKPATWLFSGKVLVSLHCKSIG